MTKRRPKTKLTFFGHVLTRRQHLSHEYHDAAYGHFMLNGTRCYVDVYDSKYGGTVTSVSVGLGSKIEMNGGADGCAAALGLLEGRVLDVFKKLGALNGYDVEA